MLFRGLVPPDRPLYIHELKPLYEAEGGQYGSKNGLTGDFYVWMVKKYIKPYVDLLYPDYCIWEVYKKH